MSRLEDQSDLSMETIRANAHVEPQQQIELARYIRLHARELHPSLAWRGQPTNDQIYKICEILFDTLLTGINRGAVRSDRQLAFLVTKLQELGATGFIRDQAFASGARVTSDPSERVENALEFLRNWASFHFPNALTALERIQTEVFESLGLMSGSYTAFAVRIENLMLPPALVALDEYGLPIQIAVRLERLLSVEDGVDAVLNDLRHLNIDQLRLSSFEAELLEEVRESL